MRRIKKLWLQFCGYRAYPFVGLMTALQSDDHGDRILRRRDNTIEMLHPGDWMFFDFQGDEYAVTDEVFQRDYISTGTISATFGAYLLVKYRGGSHDALARPRYTFVNGTIKARWEIYVADEPKQDVDTKWMTLRYVELGYDINPSLWTSIRFNWDQLQRSHDKLLALTIIGRKLKWAIKRPFVERVYKVRRWINRRRGR